MRQAKTTTKAQVVLQELNGHNGRLVLGGQEHDQVRRDLGGREAFFEHSDAGAGFLGLVHEAEQQRAVGEDGFLLLGRELVVHAAVNALEPLERVKQIAVVADGHDVVGRHSANRLVVQPDRTRQQPPMSISIVSQQHYTQDTYLSLSTLR